MFDIHEIIIRHLDGSATKEEKEYLLSWLKQSEENRKEYFEIRDLWLYKSTSPQNDRETEMALTRLRNRILASAQGKKKGLRKQLYFFSRIAAIFLLLLSVGYIVFDQKNGEQATVMVNRLLTAQGSKGEFSLPDGTIVWLNSNSALEYPESFSGKERKVRLQGEAYFEVKRDEKKPFRVDAGEMVIEVLGTKFVVQNYDKKPEVETILVEGKVKVTGSHLEKEVVLSPTQRIAYSKQTNEITMKTVDTSDYMSWIYDQLSFDNDRLSDIIINMERWYGIEIKCPESFARSTRMSFTIRGESPDEILKAMQLVAPMQYKLEKDTLYIFPKEK